MNRGKLAMPFRSTVWLMAFGMGLLLTAFPGEVRGEEDFQSATICSQCHPEIYRTWRSSRHASASTGPLFQISLDRIRQEDPQLASPCEHCHNPLRFFLDPEDPKAGIFAQEGVTCDFCHSVEFLIQGIHGAGFPRYLVNPGIKFGPYPTAGESKNTPHETKFAPLHIRSVFCAGCHEYRNRHGVSILSTYSEWEESFYRGKSVHCQFCHLPELFDARFMDPQKKKGPVSHDMVGGHSRDLLARALPIHAILTTNGKEAFVTIHVKNDFVGHKAPSGIPIHRLRLETTLYDEDRRVLGRGEEIFERVLGDGHGNPLRMPEQFFPTAKEVLKDNRIAPKEVRKVVHRFLPVGKEPKSAEISLLYEIFLSELPSGLQSSSISILRIAVPVRAGFSWRIVALLALAGATLVLAAVLVFRRFRP
jgi:hypothetical protein